MTQYGMQPSGMVRLSNGTLWDPSTPLPPEAVAAFNSTPMGNPLAPSTTVVLPAPAAPDPAPVPTSAPSGMFGASPDKMPVAAVDVAVPDVPKPGFFDKGGTGSKIGNAANAFATTWLATQGNPYGLAKIQGEQEDAKLAEQAKQEQAKQMASLYQALLLQKLKPQEQGSVQKNYEFIKSIDPKRADSYLSAEANPQSLQLNPETGQLGFFPKGGIQAPSAPASKVVGGRTYYYVNGDWYDNPEGK